MIPSESTIISPGQGDTYYVLGAYIVYKVRGGDAAPSMFEEILPVGASGPPHFHHEQDETFYVVEGEYLFTVNGRSFTAGAGTFLHVPRGTVHAQKNIGDRAGKALVTISPGPLVRFFDEVGLRVDDATVFKAPEGPPDMDKVVASCLRNGLELVLA